MVVSKTKRPKKLSKWVHFEQQSKLSRGENLLGGSAKYIQLVRRENRPVIYLHELGKQKYKWSVGIDLVEGFERSGVKLTEKYAQYAYEVLIEQPESVKKGYGSVGAIQSFGDAKYSSLEEAIAVANKLAELPESAFIFPEK